MREDFVIVDMYRQQDEIMSQVEGHSEAEIIEWPGNRGKLSSRQNSDGTVIYDFESYQNIPAIFYFHEGKLALFDKL